MEKTAGTTTMLHSAEELVLTSLAWYKVFLVVIFWFWRILYGNPGGPRLLWLRRVNRVLREYLLIANSTSILICDDFPRTLYAMAADCQHTNRGICHAEH